MPAFSVFDFSKISSHSQLGTLLSKTQRQRWPCTQLCTPHGSLEAGRDPFEVDNGPLPMGHSLGDAVSNWPFPFLPPVELDTRCFKAIISVIMDKLRMDCCVPHHLPTQTSGWLGKTALILGKPSPGYLIPGLCLEHPQPPDGSIPSGALLPPHTLCQYLPRIWQAPTPDPTHAAGGATRAGGRRTLPSLARTQH